MFQTPQSNSRRLFAQSALTIAALLSAHVFLSSAYRQTLIPAHKVSLLDHDWRSSDQPLDLLIVGDSHARNAVEPRAFGPAALSLAVGGEHFTKTRHRMRHLFEQHPREVQRVLIPLDHVSLSGWKVDQFAPEAVWGQHIDFWALGRQRNALATYAPMALKASIFPYFGEFESAVQLGAGTRGFQQRGDRKSEPPRSMRRTGVQAAQMHLADNAAPHPELISDLQTLVVDFLDRGTEVILVSYPVTGGYLRTASELGVPHPTDHPQVAELIRNPGVHHLDHSADFVGMPQMFWDGDHLNASGRKALSLALRREIISIR